MIEISVTSTKFPEDSWQVTFSDEDMDKLEVWRNAFGVLQDILFEKHTDKSPVTGMLEMFERKKEAGQ